MRSRSIAAIIILVVLLVSVRIFQDALFYDPFLAFFRAEDKVIPQYDALRLSLGLFFRYGLNMIVSLGIIWFFFKDKGIVRLSAILYSVFFLVLIMAFFLVLNADKPNLLALFYIRRFLIQPLFLILFIPAFYYQRSLKQN